MSTTTAGKQLQQESVNSCSGDTFGIAILCESLIIAEPDFVITHIQRMQLYIDLLSNNVPRIIGHTNGFPKVWIFPDREAGVALEILFFSSIGKL